MAESMFEEEGSSRRRPRGFRKKHMNKPYPGHNTAYYTNMSECIGNTNEIQSPYSGQSFAAYEYSPVPTSTVPPTYVTQENNFYPSLVNTENLSAYRPHASPPSGQNPLVEYASYSSPAGIYGPSPYNNNSGSESGKL